MKPIKYTGKLRDDEWDKVAYILSRMTKINLTQYDYRTFIEVVLWVILNKKAWVDIPTHFGKSKSIYTRFYRWNESGLWHLLARRTIDDQELHWMLSQINDRCDFLNRRKDLRSQDLMDKRHNNMTPSRDQKTSLVVHHESTPDQSY